MFDQQITIEGNMADTSARFAPGASFDVDVVDIAVLLSFEELQEDGGADLVVELIALYLQDAPVKIDAIRQAVMTADGESVKRAAHSLKGSSGTLGIRQLASVCGELECLADAGLTPRANGMLHRLENEFVRVQEALTSELDRRIHQVSSSTR
jgi:two-component system sensor histidine kinase/response regulator